MRSITSVAHALAVLGGVLVALGRILGGFPSPDGIGATLFFVGIGLGLAAELGRRVVSRRS